jgi:putative oxidoreductase
MHADVRHVDRHTDLLDWGLAILRVVVGLTFFMHGWQKLFEMGLPGVTGFFGQVGLPAPSMMAALVSFLELAGGAALIVGLATRWVAILLVVEMLVAMFIVHLPRGFFVAEGGFELVLLLGGACLALALTGPGRFALDRMFARERRARVLDDMPADVIRR